MKIHKKFKTKDNYEHIPNTNHSTNSEQNLKTKIKPNIHTITYTKVISRSHVTTCNSMCHCKHSMDTFTPVCDISRHRVFFSPCFAGCTESNFTNSSNQVISPYIISAYRSVSSYHNITYQRIYSHIVYHNV